MYDFPSAVYEHFRTWYQNSRVNVILQIVSAHAHKSSRAFSCDVISSQFCTSSYLRPPCWFPLSMARYGKTKQKCPVTFYLVHTTVPNYNTVTRILALTLGINFTNHKFKRLLLFFSIPRHTRRKPSVGEKSCAHRCVLLRANSL